MTGEIPQNTVRCVKCGGPILAGAVGEPHTCRDCGRPIYPSDGLVRSGYHWQRRNGWLTSVLTEDD